MKRLSTYSGIALFLGLMLLLALNFGSEAFTIHMLVHMGIVAIVCPLLAIGLVGSKNAVIHRLSGISPLSASLIELVLVWLWHVPIMRRLADGSIFGTTIEQFAFLAGGLTLWLACVSRGGIAGTAGLLFTSMHMTLLGVLLSLAPRPLYGAEAVTCFGIVLDAATDQQIGGVVMLLIGAVSYLVGGIALLADALKFDAKHIRESC